MRYRFGGLLGEFFRIDADRKYRDARRAVARGDDTLVNHKAEIRLDIRQEVFAIILGLEPDQIISEHCLDQFTMMRHPADGGARRPWRMQEETERLRDAEIAQFRAQPGNDNPESRTRCRAFGNAAA